MKTNFALLLLIPLLYGCDRTPKPAAAIPSEEQKNSNFVKYDSTFFRGDASLTAAACKQLKNEGIRTIISCRISETEKQNAAEAELQVWEMGWDTASPLNENQIQEFLTILGSMPAPFYIHADRAFLGLTYRIYSQGWDREKALREFEKQGGDRTRDKEILKSIIKD